PRTEVMFGPPGRLYVYFTYGMHWCANVVCGVEGAASAVLLRGGEVVEGLELARSRRPAARRDVDLARGPARLAQALGLTGADNGLVLGAGRGELHPPEHPPSRYETGPRVGVAGPGGDGQVFPWRFWLPGEPTVSAYRPGVRRRRRRGTGTAPATGGSNRGRTPMTIGRRTPVLRRSGRSTSGPLRQGDLRPVPTGRPGPLRQGVRAGTGGREVRRAVTTRTAGRAH